MLMFGWDFEVSSWSRFWIWNWIKICVWTCDMTHKDTLESWTQPSGLLCLWQCFYFNANQTTTFCSYINHHCFHCRFETWNSIPVAQLFAQSPLIWLPPTESQSIWWNQGCHFTEKSFKNRESWMISIQENLPNLGFPYFVFLDILKK